MHSIEYTRDALRVLAKMPRNLRELVASKIESVAVAPIGTRGQVYE